MLMVHSHEVKVGAEEEPGTRAPSSGPDPRPPLPPPLLQATLTLAFFASLLIFADRERLSICYRALFVKSNQGLARRCDK